MSSDYDFESFLGECVLGGIALLGYGLYVLSQPEKTQFEKDREAWWADPKNRNNIFVGTMRT